MVPAVAADRVVLEARAVAVDLAAAVIVGQAQDALIQVVHPVAAVAVGRARVVPARVLQEGAAAGQDRVVRAHALSRARRKTIGDSHSKKALIRVGKPAIVRFALANTRAAGSSATSSDAGN